MSLRSISPEACKLALEWTHTRLARRFKMLNVGINRASWRAKEGAGVRRGVGPYKEVVASADAAAWVRCSLEVVLSFNLLVRCVCPQSKLQGCS